MPAQQGEVALLTLFADIHYIFSPPHVKPAHHRFDKTSYVYLFHNPMQRRGRLEIANHAGTPEQDAFVGYLDTVRVERSHKHPTLFTLVVDGSRSHNGSATSTPQQDPHSWTLPAPDQRNEGKYTYKLHTIDIYFWTVEDSSMFLDSLRRVLQENQLRILDAPATASTTGPEYRDNSMSPVVQKLEQAAISRPYQGRNDSISTTHSFAGPPTAPTPASMHAVSPPPPTAEPAHNFAPMAYNPAAPAAPEPIAHREKTPPPPDAESGTGLTAAATHDYGNQFAAPPLHHQGSFPQQHQPYMPGPPQQSPPGFQQSHGATPPGPGIQRTNTTSSFPPPPPQSFSTPSQSHNSGTPPHLGHSTSGYPTQQYANYAGPGHQPVSSPGFPPVPGNKPLQSPGFGAPSPGFPPRGYSQYNYGAPQSQQQQGDPHSTYQQAYQPTQHESTIHNNLNPAKPPAPGKGGRLESGAKKLEKGVGGFLKKLDKKF